MNIDGDNQNLGVYLMVETVNKSFIHRNVKKDARNGDLYKISWGSGEAGTFNNTDNRLFGIESQTKNGNGTFGHKNYTYDLKTNKTTSNHMTFKAFISTIADSNFHGGDSYAFMQSNSVYDEFISYAAGAYLCGDPDDLRGNGNNTYVYFANVNGTSQIVFIPTDNDRSFGSDGGGQNPTGSHGAKVSPFADTTGYYGYSNICNLFAKTVVSSNSKDIRLDYLKKIKSIKTIPPEIIDKTTYIESI